MEPGAAPAKRVSVAADRISGADLVRLLDLLALALALPVFVLLDAPLAGYLVAGGAWLAGRVGKQVADRHRARAIAAENRRAALGLTAAAMLGRLWLLAGAILVVGLVDRDAGLAGAVLAAVLVTTYLFGEGIAQLFSEEGR